MIIADIALVPRDLLSLASAHGARVHRNVIDGYSQRHAASAARTPDDYAWENLQRVVRSLVGLIEFDVGQLPVGFEADGQARPLELEGLRALIAVTYGYSRGVDVFADYGTRAVHSARLVARKTPMRNPLVYWGRAGPAVVATSGAWLYRWRLDTPTPLADIRLGDDRLGIDDLFAMGQPDDPTLLITTYAGPVAEIAPAAEPRWVAYPRWSSSSLWWRDDANDALLHCEADSELLLTLRDTTSGGEMASVDLARLPDTYPRLFENPPELVAAGADPIAKVGQLHDLWRDRLLGNACLVASLRLHPTGNALGFLDARSLAPIRAPVMTELPMGRASIASAAGRTLLLAPAICRGGGRPGGVYAWDLSHGAGKRAAPFLGPCHEEVGSDFVALAIAARANAWDAYYVVHRLDGDGKSALWRLAWPAMQPELVTELGDTVSRIHVLPR